MPSSNETLEEGLSRCRQVKIGVIGRYTISILSWFGLLRAGR